jgi:hypothetical protein
MLRAEPLHRIAGVVFLVTLTSVGCERSSSKPADASKPDGSRADSKPFSSDAGATDTGSLFAADTDPAQDVESSSSEAGTAISPVNGGSDAEKQPTTMATIVVLPDTQYYNNDYSGHAPVFAMQTNWILEQKLPLNIQAVLHVGDIVDNCNSVNQWTNANAAMRLLDGHVPYFVVSGNHDTDDRRRGLINDYFGPASLPWVTSTMTIGLIENSYALVDIGPQEWLVLGLEFGPRDAVMTWADAVLKAYPNTPAIIVTHAYLYGDGNRYDINVSGLDKHQPNYQWYIPQSDEYTPSQGINDGEMIWQKLILPNPNVRLVFSGHVMSAARLTSTRPDGSRVHQMLSDYQWLNGPYFGYGYLRVLQFNFAKKTIQVQTYSPYMDDYLTDDANQFTLDLNL